jgi:hypothetical protein
MMLLECYDSVCDYQEIMYLQLINLEILLMMLF